MRRQCTRSARGSYFRSFALLLPEIPDHLEPVAGRIPTIHSQSCTHPFPIRNSPLHRICRHCTLVVVKYAAVPPTCRIPPAPSHPQGSVSCSTSSSIPAATSSASALSPVLACRCRSSSVSRRTPRANTRTRHAPSPSFSFTSAAACRITIASISSPMRLPRFAASTSPSTATCPACASANCCRSWRRQWIRSLSSAAARTTTTITKPRPTGRLSGRFYSCVPRRSRHRRRRRS